MKQSESIANLAAALVKASGEMQPVAKDRVNPHFKNKYATLDAITEAVRPVLAKHGLAIVQGSTVPETNEGVLVGFALETMLIHSSGEWLANSVVMPVEKASAQGAGSAISYGRRYGLSALLGLTSDEDDDGETATNHAPRAATTAAPRPTPSARPSVAPSSPTPSAATPNGAVPNCPKCGGLVWDNREGKKNPKAPDFKCRDKSCDGAIWPPKAPAKPAPAPVEDEYAWMDEPADSVPF